MAKPAPLKPSAMGSSVVPAASWHSLIVETREEEKPLHRCYRANRCAQACSCGAHLQGWHAAGDAAPPLE